MRLLPKIDKPFCLGYTFGEESRLVYKSVVTAQWLESAHAARP